MPSLAPQREPARAETVLASSAAEPARKTLLERVACGLARWPGLALAAWLAGWLVLGAGASVGWGGWPLLALAWAPSLALAFLVVGRWRRLIAACGLPAALLLQQGAPAWAWLALAGVLLALYPVSAWRDAPLFPTPPDALTWLAPRLRLAPGARVLDAGSGLGHGLTALRRAFPQAHLEGVERSGLLVLACALRRRVRARVRRGDLWAASWARYDLVYFFQRPESMAPAWRKACAEMRPGSWLLSLEFPVQGVTPTHEAGPASGGGRRVFAYRVPPRNAIRTQPPAPPADIE
jgi:hypothetical protein